MYVVDKYLTLLLLLLGINNPDVYVSCSPNAHWLYDPGRLIFVHPEKEKKEHGESEKNIEIEYPRESERERVLDSGMETVSQRDRQYNVSLRYRDAFFLSLSFYPMPRKSPTGCFPEKPNNKDRNNIRIWNKMVLFSQGTVKCRKFGEASKEPGKNGRGCDIISRPVI